jgi:hypothetical protein
MAVDDAMLLQPPADLHRPVIASAARALLVAPALRSSTPPAPAEGRRAAAAAAAVRVATSR